MSGRSYGEDSRRPCPYCGALCDADFVDVGIGEIQCGPYACEECNASEIGPEGAERGFVPPEGSKGGWYPPGGPTSPHANTAGGVLVDHQTAKALYRMGLLDKKPD